MDDGRLVLSSVRGTTDYVQVQEVHVTGGSAAEGSTAERSYSAASAGGAGGASGVEFQNHVFAWAASFLLAREPLPGVGVAGAVARVGAQTGHAVDDVAALTEEGNAVFIQAKIGLGLSSAASSPISNALDQAIRQYLVGTVPNEGRDPRRIDPRRDAILICTDQRSPVTVREHLARAVSRTATQPPGTPLGFDLTPAQRRALDVLLVHIRRIWLVVSGVETTDEKIRALLGTLRFLSLDLVEGRKDQAAAVSVIQRGLVDSRQASNAWGVLVEEGQAAARGQQWRNRHQIVVSLSLHGIAAELLESTRAIAQEPGAGDGSESTERIRQSPSLVAKLQRLSLGTTREFSGALFGSPVLRRRVQRGLKFTFDCQQALVSLILNDLECVESYGITVSELGFSINLATLVVDRYGAVLGESLFDVLPTPRGGAEFHVGKRDPWYFEHHETSEADGGSMTYTLGAVPFGRPNYNDVPPVSPRLPADHPHYRFSQYSVRPWSTNGLSPEEASEAIAWAKRSFVVNAIIVPSCEPPEDALPDPGERRTW